MRTRSRPRLFVTDRGAGEPVLLITGWMISSAVFDPVAELYLPHVRVIAYDHRGTGRSAPWPAPVSMAMLAADAARVLDDRGVASCACGRIVDGRWRRARARRPDAPTRQEPRPGRRGPRRSGDSQAGRTRGRRHGRHGAVRHRPPPASMARRGPVLASIPGRASGEGVGVHALLCCAPCPAVDGRLADAGGGVLQPPRLARSRARANARAPRRTRRDGPGSKRPPARGRHPRR